MFQLKKICPRVYLLSFNNSIELCAHFMRFQEMYESDCPRFKGKSFELIDYITWYSKNNEKDSKFTYFNDWGGFNIPLNIITDWKPTKDVNNYDKLMLAIADKIQRDEPDASYLIGCTTGSVELMAHEVAHGLYYTDANYAEEMDELLEKFPIKLYKKCTNVLSNMGYDLSVLPDEMQAYLSTGVCKGFPRVSKDRKEIFQKIFKKYIKKNKIRLEV